MLSERIVLALKRAEDPLPAKKIAQLLGVTRAEANSTLYSGLGRTFRIHDTNPPTWSLVDVSAPQAKKMPQFKQIEDEIHIDAPGGDWKLKIRIAPMSVNDPVAIVEPMGERSRLVTVSSAVARTGDFGQEVPDACLAIAAAVLASEMLTTLNAQGITHLEFGQLLRDIYVSVGAHSRKVSDKSPE